MTLLSRQDPPSLGDPRLFFALGGVTSTRAPQRQFALVDHVTTIGSAPDADLCLAGLEPRHAEIRHDEHDCYTYVLLAGSPGGSGFTGAGLSGLEGHTVLHTGTRLEFGDWTVSFYRDEFADSIVALDSPPGRRFAGMREKARRAQADPANHQQ